MNKLQRRISYRGACAVLVWMVLASSPAPASAAGTVPITNGSLFYVADGGVGRANPDGTDATRSLIRDGGGPAVAPSGTELAFTSTRDGNEEIYRASSDGRGAVNLSRSPAAERQPSWSATGRIAFVSTRDGASHLFDMDRNGNGVRQLTSGPFNDSAPAWSPDGGAIVFVSDRDGGLDLYTRDGAGVIRRITSDGAPKGDPIWGPTGLIAFTSLSGDVSQVSLIQPDGLARRVLTGLAGGARSPAWSPDGTQIAFVSTVEGQDSIRFIARDGSSVSSLEPSVGGSEPAWARLPAGKRPAGGTSFIVRRDSGTVRIRPGVLDADGTLPIVVRDRVQTPTSLTVDARAGTVTVLVKSRQSGSDISTITATRGRFTVQQTSADDPPVIQVREPEPERCRDAHISRPIDFHVGVKGKGRYLGRHGSASAVGTVWAATELCGATAFKVKSGELKTSVKKGSVPVRRSKGRVLWGNGKGKFRRSGEFSSATIRG